MILTQSSAIRYHDISCGHRVAGHEDKCRGLHGHNYRIHFECRGRIDAIGRVIDFGVIKSRLCMWLEENWDHKFLIWKDDPIKDVLLAIARSTDEVDFILNSIVAVPFNPTAENMADYLLQVIGPVQLNGTGVQLVTVRVDETRKCSAQTSIIG